ncbi:copia protein isoform X1 [Bacillus rossius redtenbacheri]|uniref:copia protein isoform X1 n=1 Tax=Bacillus rossius redtenbacheri TaxID=93214 RepID=UPI002FDEDEF1
MSYSSMANAANVPFGIRPFDGVNFSNWFYRMKLLLEQNGVLHMLTTEPPTVEADLKRFKQEDVKARNLLVQGLADNMLPMIMNKITAKEIVDTLATTYEKRGMKSMVTAQKAWRKLEYKKEKPLQEFLQQFESMASEVKVAGGKIEEDEMVNQLLVAMPSDFDSVVSAMDILYNKDKSAVKFEYVKNTLLAEEERLLKKDESPQNVFAAYKGLRGQSHQYSQHKHNKGNYVPGRSFNGKCYYCKVQGHMKFNCPKLKNKDTAATTNEVEFSFLTSFDTESSSCGHVDSEQPAMNDGELTEVIFVIDSGASCHIIKSCYQKYLSDRTDVNFDINVAKAGESLKAVSKGNISCMSEGGENIKIRDVLVCENLAFNLLSVRKLEEKGCKVSFENSCVKIVCGRKVMLGQVFGRLYVVKMHLIPEHANAAMVKAVSSNVMHRRMGHSSKYPTELCDVCLKGKQTKLPYLKAIPEERKAKRVLQCVSSDVCGKISPPTYDGFNYFVTFIDHYSHFCVTYLLRNKSEVFEKFKMYTAMVEAKFNSRIENLRCDRGGEYVSSNFKSFCEKKGISVSYSMARNPSQNGMAERINRTLLEKTRCLLLDSNFGKEMWGEAIMTATYLTNRLATSALPNGIVPAERWYNHKPDLSKIKVFGCPAYSFIHKEDRDGGKLSDRSKRLFLTGYCDNGYRLWNPEKKNVEFARNVIFDELGYTESPSSGSITHTATSEGVTSNIPNETQDVCPQFARDDTQMYENNQSDDDGDGDFIGFHPEGVYDESTGIRSSRHKKLPKYLEDFELNFAVDVLALSVSSDVPNSFKDAVKDAGWRQALNEELSSLESNETWEVVEAPMDASVIDSRWIFSSKSVDGTTKKKARLVARGYQQPTLENEDIFSPVARMTTLRVLLSVAVERGLQLHQLDVRSAFLKSKLPVPVYMKPPDGVQCSDDKLLKLNKALYGLRQSPKAWNDYVNSELINLGFMRSKIDPCLYHRGTFYILVWVDDFLLVSNSGADLEDTKSALKSKMGMRDLSSNEKLHFLGMDILKGEDGSLILSQSDLIRRVLEKFNMIECKPSKVPIQPKLNLSCDGECKIKVPYKELLGSLMYLTVCTRPDLCFSVSYFGRFQKCYSYNHWRHLKHVLKYLKYTVNIGLKLAKSYCNTLTISSYVDADYASDTNDRKSISGFVTKLNNNVICWGSKNKVW